MKDDNIDPFGIVEESRKLDRSENNDSIRLVWRGRHSYEIGVIDKILLEIDALPRAGRNVSITNFELLLGLDEGEGDELLVQNTKIAIKKSLLLDLESHGFIRDLVSDLYKTIDEKSNVPIHVRVAVFSFVPSTLKNPVGRSTDATGDEMRNANAGFRMQTSAG